MTFNPNLITKKVEPKPPLMLIYAKNGIGKSSFLKSIEGAFVIDIENKLNNTDKVSRYVPETYEDVVEALTYVLNQEKNEYKAIAIDSLDWLEGLIHKKICKDTGAKTISDPYVKATGYGNGYIMAANLARNEILPLCEDIRNKHNVPVVMVCHAAIVVCKDPDIEPYDVHELKLHDKLRSVISERVEAKVYAKLRMNIDQNGKAVPTEERILITTPQKGIEAKNNLFLPTEVNISYSNGWNDFVSAINTNQPTN
jgi:hypothetical protein